MTRGAKKGHPKTSNGRPTDYRKPKRVSVRVGEEQYERFLKSGGANWLRKMLGEPPKSTSSK